MHWQMYKLNFHVFGLSLTMKTKTQGCHLFGTEMVRLSYTSDTIFIYCKGILCILIRFVLQFYLLFDYIDFKWSQYKMCKVIFEQLLIWETQ